MAIIPEPTDVIRTPKLQYALNQEQEKVERLEKDIDDLLFIIKAQGRIISRLRKELYGARTDDE